MSAELDDPYLEYFCQICGVSFSINRFRHLGEPSQAAWNNTSNPGVHALKDRPTDDDCTNCHTVEPGTGDDNDGDSYVYESDQGEEPYEYTTPPASPSVDRTGDSLGCHDPLPCSPATSDSDGEEEDYRRFVDSTVNVDWYFAARDYLADNSSSRAEHIAGTDCNCTDGYNGNRISVDEMKCCATAQFLVPKASAGIWMTAWQPEPDDEEFEEDCEYFLSYLSDGILSTLHLRADKWAYDPPTHGPHRHGLDWIRAANFCRIPGLAHAVAMPFHPYCLEAYKRASLRRTGAIGIQELTEWYRLENNVRDFHAFPRHPAVLRGRAYTWRHNRGDEWLAANPILVPGLSPLLDSFKIQDAGNNVATRGDPCGDLFSRLPSELRLQVLSHLAPLEIANLAQSSPAVRRSPPSFFHVCLKRAMPWFWEAWCDLPYPFLATTTRVKDRTLRRRWANLGYALDEWWIPTLEEEKQHYGPGELDAAVEYLRQLRGQLVDAEAEERRPLAAHVLEEERADWRGLFMLLARNCGGLKGLRNRARIWDDCEYILDRIEHHKAEGRMGDGIKVDAVAIAEEFLRGNH